MGMYDAKEDGVIIDNTGSRPLYHIKCQCGCGRTLIRTQYSRKREYICDYCKGVIKEKERLANPVYDVPIETKKEVQLRKAYDNLGRQGHKGETWQTSYDVAKSRCERYGSIPEAMMAIVLLHNGYRIIPQQKVGRYVADFVLPDNRIVVEVDGELYHNNLQKEGVRDIAIKCALGTSWKIIHIPASYIMKDAQKCVKLINKGTQETI